MRKHIILAMAAAAATLASCLNIETESAVDYQHSEIIPDIRVGKNNLVVITHGETDVVIPSNIPVISARCGDDMVFYGTFWPTKDKKDTYTFGFPVSRPNTPDLATDTAESFWALIQPSDDRTAYVNYGFVETVIETRAYGDITRTLRLSVKKDDDDNHIYPVTKANEDATHCYYIRGDVVSISMLEDAEEPFFNSVSHPGYYGSGRTVTVERAVLGVVGDDGREFYLNVSGRKRDNEMGRLLDYVKERDYIEVYVQRGSYSYRTETSHLGETRSWHDFAGIRTSQIRVVHPYQD